MAVSKTQKNTSAKISDVLLSPRVTEKGAISADHNAYIFNVNPRATKTSIAAAVTSMYKVTPIKVTTVTIPTKRVFAKGKRGTKGGGKKAYVYLKKGDQIQII